MYLFHRVYPNMRGVYLVETGVYTAKAGMEVIVEGFCTIFQVIGRFRTKAYAYRRKH